MEQDTFERNAASADERVSKRALRNPIFQAWMMSWRSCSTVAYVKQTNRNYDVTGAKEIIKRKGIINSAKTERSRYWKDQNLTQKSFMTKPKLSFKTFEEKPECNVLRKVCVAN